MQGLGLGVAPDHGAQKYTGWTFMFRELISTKPDRKVILKDLICASLD